MAALTPTPNDDLDITPLPLAQIAAEARAQAFAAEAAAKAAEKAQAELEAAFIAQLEAENQRERKEEFGVSADDNTANRAAGQAALDEAETAAAEAKMRMELVLEAMKASEAAWAEATKPLTAKQITEKKNRREALRKRLGGSYTREQLDKMTKGELERIMKQISPNVSISSIGKQGKQGVIDCILNPQQEKCQSKKAKKGGRKSKRTSRKTKKSRRK